MIKTMLINVTMLIDIANSIRGGLNHETEKKEISPQKEVGRFIIYNSDVAYNYNRSGYSHISNLLVFSRRIMFNRHYQYIIITIIIRK